MPQGFFQPTKTDTKPSTSSLIPKCGQCGLLHHCKSPKMPVTGEGRLGVLAVAEAPGSDEDDQNEQLVGKAGKELRRFLHKIGVSLDKDCWKTNALICRPWKQAKDGTISNRTPTNEEIECCRPNLLRTIRELNPRVIIPLGEYAVRSLLGPIWGEGTGSIGKWRGWRIPLQKWNTWVCPTSHPSYIARAENLKEGPAIRLWFERDLRGAFELEERPWDEIPDYASQVRVEFDPDEAARWIRDKIEKGGAVSFDLETNMLKPDSDDAEIVCCSVCWKGKETIAFPWVGEAIVAMGELIRSEQPKIGFNSKFESRWIVKEFGYDVRNWIWDGMLSAHHLDNRPGITSVEFQAMVRLGQEPWGSEVSPYLKAKSSNEKNNIRQLDLRTLCLYCGLDALIEFKVAKDQKREMKQGKS